MKIKKIIAFIFATCLVFLCIWFYISFKGNPIIQLIATSKMKDYTKEYYPNLEYEFGNTIYNFKDDNYYLHIDVLNSLDKDFSICYDAGKISDDYIYRVEKKLNLANRIHTELNDEKYDQPSKNIFKEKFDWQVLELSEKNIERLPNDIPIQQVLNEQTFELHIYLKNREKLDENTIEQYFQQIIQEYQKIGIHLEVIEINDHKKIVIE